MTPYIVTSFDTLDRNERENALGKIAFHEGCACIRYELTGTIDPFEFMNLLAEEFGDDIEDNCDAITRISDVARAHSISFDIVTGKPYFGRKS